MWNQVILVALIPAIMAKPIVQREESSVLKNSSAMEGAALRNNTVIAMAKEMDRNNTTNDHSRTKSKAIPRVNRRNVAATQSQNQGEIPATGFISIPRASVERRDTPTPASNRSSSTMTPSSASAAPSQGNCNCISACASEDGKATQMKCMQKCAKDCDGDDDTKKKTDIVSNLLGSLGVRHVPVPVRQPSYRPSRKPIHFAAASEDAEYEDCMKSCKAHNCQHSEVGLSITSCGNTSCESSCSRFKKGKSSGGIYKRRVPPVVQHTPVKTSASEIHRPKAAYHESGGYEDCMKKCKTHNCQHSEVGLSISQCGNTSCEESCARFKEQKSGILTKKQLKHPKKTKTETVPDVDPVAAVPEVGGAPKGSPRPAHVRPSSPSSPGVPGSSPQGPPNPFAPTTLKSSSSETEYDSCVRECKTHNCQKSGVGIDISQCGNTSCESSCSHLRDASAASVSASKVKTTYAPGSLAAHPGPDRPTAHLVPQADASESEAFSDCMTKCRAHNCQKAMVGLEVSQCGDTACEDSCARYKGGKSAHVGVGSREVQGVQRGAATAVGEAVPISTVA